MNPIDVFRTAIAETLSPITGVESARIHEALAWTATLDKGDLILAVPRLRIKGTAPEQLAQECAAKFPPHPLLSPPSPIGINLRFDFAPSILPKIVLNTVFRFGDSYGSDTSHSLHDAKDPARGRKKIVIEFSSPNIAKKFHAGHLRSTIIGQFLANLFSQAGWDVVRLNYLGDWGRQYGLLAIAWKRYGSEEAFAVDPVGHLFDIYVKISADFAPEEESFKLAGKRGEDTTALELQGLLGEAKEFRDLSIGRYKKTYARLNTHFDEYSGEPQVLQSTMEEAEYVLKEKGIIALDNGAWIVDFTRFGAKKLETAVVRNRNGTSNYLLRDIGAAIQRHRTHNMDRMIYVVMSEQETHLLRLFRILELMGGEYAILSSKMQHVTFGKACSPSSSPCSVIPLTPGKVIGMSTRRGTVRFLDDILTSAEDAMHTVMRSNATKYAQIPDPEHVSSALGISAIMIQDMSAKRVHDYTFSMERMTSFEGDTGPYLQYAHARLCSIARNSGFTTQELRGADLGLLKERHAVDLLRSMARGGAGDEDAGAEHGGNLSSGYDVLRVVGVEREVGRARAALLEGARQVVGNGMRLLGLRPVERM
ncbi:Arginine--tRNA ligase-like protein 1 [Elsinoe fawcettii]|nr:Arginine--tRNA ligase-like protein 1 [Elsinoe fawcettii]